VSPFSVYHPEVIAANPCVFRRDPGSRSDVTRAAVPTAPGQPFRRDPGSHSGHPGSRSDVTRARQG